MDNGAKQKGIMRVKLKFTCYMLILITTAKKKQEQQQTNGENGHQRAN